MTDLMRNVVYIVGAALLLCVAGIILLAAIGPDPIPDILQVIAASCLTGLIGLLVPTKNDRRN